jgi:peptidoglycan/xylan/chitin deacetylase (PgdA/CDA1 family)
VTPLSRRGLLGLAAAATVAACGRSVKRAAGVPTGQATSATPASRRPAFSARPGGPATEVVNGPRDRPLVALTFHGSGDPSLATSLLQAAEGGGARITVFVVGTWLATHPELAKRMLGAGHELANHTFTHPDLGGYSRTAAEQEFARCAEVLARLTGGNGTYARPSAMDRATPTVLAAAGSAGYATSVAYDVNPHDYQDPGSDAVTSRVLAGVRPGSIVSLHLGHPGTVTALPRVLDGLRTRGLTPVTVSQLLG